MQLNYVRVWMLKGLNKLPTQLPTSTLGNPPITFLLTTDPEPYFIHLDKCRALGAQMLKVVYQGVEDGSLEERIDLEIRAAKARRAENRQINCYLVAQAVAGASDVDLGVRHDAGDYEVATGGIDHKSVRKMYRQTINSFIAGFTLSLPPNSDHKCVENGSVIYLTTEAGKPIYLLSFEAGFGRASISSPAPTDILTTAEKMAAVILADTTLRRPIALLVSSSTNISNPLEAYLDAWNALEIFTDSVFASTYRAQWHETLEAAVPPAGKPVLDLQFQVMKAEYRLGHKFLVIATILCPDAAKEDHVTFLKLKKYRDGVLHGTDDPAGALPTEQVQLMLHKYLREHYEAHHVHQAS